MSAPTILLTIKFTPGSAFAEFAATNQSIANLAMPLLDRT